MIIDLEFKEGDSKEFLTAIGSLIAVLVKDQEPKHLYVVRINKWFDHKWLGYSGRGRIKFDSGLWIDTALEPMWKEKLTFPPFNPNQIGDQVHWERKEDGTYGGSKKEPRWVHKYRARSSSSNLQNRVADFTNSGLFIWFTSGTEANMHGSIMVYIVDNQNASAWYASFKKEKNWAIDRTKGIEKENVEMLFPI